MNTPTQLLLALALGASLAACNDSNANDGGLVTLDVPVVDRPSTTDAGTDTATQPDVATDTAPADAATDVTPDVTADASVDAASDAAADVMRGMYVDGCFVGTPVEMTDFLNRCTTATTLPARAPRGTRLTADGGVQPLPM